MTTEDSRDPGRAARQDEGLVGAPDARAAKVLGAAAPTQALHVPTRTIALVGMAVWGAALVVTLLVPSLHTGDRSWWPWTCVSGIALGAFALWYVTRKGRGDAAGT